MATKTVLVTSIWRFYDVQSLIQKFDLALDSAVARCSFDSSIEHFVIQCQPSKEDEIAREFFKILKSYILDEQKKELSEDPFERPQVERLPWSKPAKQQDYYARAERAEQEAQRSVSLLDVSKQLINHEAFTETLDFNATTSFDRDSFNANILNSVAMSTQCRLELHDSIIRIFGDSKRELDRAVEKVKSTFRTNIGSIPRHAQFDLYYAQSLAGHKFRYSFATSIPDQSLLRDNKFAIRYYELRAVVWDTKSLQYLSTRAQSSPMKYPPDIRSCWSDSVSFSYGDDVCNPKYWPEGISGKAHFASHLDPIQITRVANWAQEVDAQPQDLFQELTAQDIIEGLSDAFEQSVGLRSDASGKTSTPNEIPDLLTGESLNESACLMRELEPNGGTIALSGHPERYVRELVDAGPAEQCLIDTSFNDDDKMKNTIILEEEGDDTLNIRQLRHLKAGQGQSKTATGLLDLLQTAMSVLLGSLEMSNPIDSMIQLDFGQIFTKASSVPKDHQCHKDRPAMPFSPAEWPKIYDTRTGEAKAKTLFSQRLTSRWEDPYFIANLCSRPGKYMFDPNAQSDRSSYTLCCTNEKSGAQIVIEVDDQGHVNTRSLAQEAGVVNIHFPKQVWDARLIAKFTPVVDDTDIGQFVPTIKHLWIHILEDADTTERERLYSRKEPHISIVSAELRRRVTYRARAPYKDVCIHITRVESLEIADLPGGFCAFASTRDNKVQSAWWEACLSSQKIDALLPKHRLSKNYGPSYWESHLTLRQALEHLFAIAEQIVSRIDDVGHASRIRAPLVDSASRSSVQKSAVRDVGSAGDR